MHLRVHSFIHSFISHQRFTKHPRVCGPGNTAKKETDSSLPPWNSLPVLETPGIKISRNTEKRNGHPERPEQRTGRQELLGRTPNSSQRRDREGYTSALTMQLTAQELKAEGAASLARDRVQPYVLCLQSGLEHVHLQAVVVLVAQKLLGGRG